MFITSTVCLEMGKKEGRVRRGWKRMGFHCLVAKREKEKRRKRKRKRKKKQKVRDT